MTKYTDDRYEGHPEIGLVGCIIANSAECMPAAIDLNLQDFTIPVFRNIYTAAKDLYLENKPIDVITLLDILKHDEYKEHIAGAVEWLPDGAAKADRAQKYRDLIKTASQRKHVIAGSKDLTQLLEQGCPLEQAQHKASEITERLAETGTDRILTARDGLIGFFDRAQRPREYLKTGFERLDNHLYIERGDFLVVGGRPSTGKTAITLQIMLQMARHHNVAYFSLETRGEKLFDRLVANYTDTPLGQIKNSNVQNWENITKYADLFSALKFTVVDASGWTVDQIRAKATQLKAEVAFVDYLGLIDGPGKSAYEVTTNVSKKLHIMAQQTRITVIALCQLNREGDNTVPTMKHLRESGQIEQDADVIILLHTPDPKEPEKRDLIIAKNKDGALVRTSLHFEGHTQKFYVIDSRES